MRKKVEVVYQKDSKDCGPCCLQSIIRYYNGNVSLEKIREDSYTSVQGTSIYHLVNSAKSYGFEANAKKNIDIDFYNVILPAIIYVRLNNGLYHFMCLYSVGKNDAVIMDPSKGKVKIAKNELARIFTGIIIELFPKNNIVYFEKSNSIYGLFLQIILKNKTLVMLLLIGGLFLIGSTIIYGFYFKTMYELVSNNKYHEIVNYIVYFFLLILLLKLVLEYLQKYYENLLYKNIDIMTIGYFLNHIYNLPLKVISTRSSGEILSRVNELNNIKNLFSSLFITTFLNLSLILALMVVLFFINKLLLFVLLIIILFYVLFSIIINPYIYRKVKKNIDLQTSFNSVVTENINMLYSFKYLNKNKYASNRSEKSLSSFIYDSYHLNKVLNILSFIQNIIYDGGVFLVNSIGFYMVYRGNLSIASIIIFNSLMIYFNSPFKELLLILPKYNLLKASFQKICDFVDLKEEEYGKHGLFKNGDITFENVCFSYNGYTDNIKNLSLKIFQGQSVLLKGKNGSGKSTLCNLLLRIYETGRGRITINNKNIKDYSICTLRDNITYVSQKERLFKGTIKDNICLDSNRGFDKVCDICFLENIASKKHLRYESEIDNDYSSLSGGERQRIILARALMQNRKIIILDEALSEVDINMERKIIEKILYSYKNRTIIYVTHKKIPNLFDRVINLDEVNNHD